MSTYEIVYLLIFLSLIAAIAASSGWVWFKVIHPFHERLLKWKRNGGKF